MSPIASKFFYLVSFSLFHTFFFFNDTATTEIYTLSLHDALPICKITKQAGTGNFRSAPAVWVIKNGKPTLADQSRSEEHTSELQSPCNLVCRLLLEKKKNANTL